MKSGVIRKRVGGTQVVQLVSTLVRTLKNDLTILWAQALAAGDGLPNATCATLGIVTTTELGSVRATSGPKDGAVWPSYWADMTSVGMLLRGDVADQAGAGGTFQARQFWRMNGRLGAFRRIECGKVGNARRPRGDDARLGLERHPLAAGDAVEQPVAEDADRRPGRAAAGPGGRDLRRGSPWASASKAAGTCAARCVPGDTAHCTSMPPLIMTFTGARDAGHVDADGLAGSARSAARAAGTWRRCRRSARGSGAARSQAANTASIPSPALVQADDAAGEARREDPVDRRPSGCPPDASACR